MAIATKHVSRWHVASRVFAATLPAYVLTNTTGVFLALLFPGDRAASIISAALVSFAIYTTIIIWIFSVRRLRTVWLGLLGSAIATGGAAWLLYLLRASA
ncbi:MAG: hypothetical protein AAGA61_07875 [Pseudomonadota bacterium]